MMRNLVHTRSVWSIIIGVLFLGFSSTPILADSVKPADHPSLVKGIKNIIRYLDSPRYAAEVSWDEHLVLAFQIARNRNPTSQEFFIINELHRDVGLKRSDVLSIALGEKGGHPTWKECRTFLKTFRKYKLKPDKTVREEAARLRSEPRGKNIETLLQQMPLVVAETSLAQRVAETALPQVSYNTYFGYLHAHSQLSDGIGTPLQAYTGARDSGGLDFFALTDHGELLKIWPWQKKWEKLIDAAEMTNDPGTFVTLWGFEWSNPFLGHINVINSQDFTGFLSHFWLHGLYNWLSRRPQAFGRFNHPGDYGFLGIEFNFMIPYPPVVEQMVGMETWNGNTSFDHYYYEGRWWFNHLFSFLDVGNLHGWKLGALGAQDNHQPDWGTKNDFRTAVLAEALTREQIIDAYRNRRFYSTEDKDLYLDVRYKGYPMGAHVSGNGDLERSFAVTAHDESGDTFQEVRLYRNGLLIDTHFVAGETIQIILTDNQPLGEDYYYVILQQDDDNDGNGRNDEAISSPIWVY